MAHLREHFYRWRSWGRCIFPLSLIVVVSAVELAFCHAKQVQRATRRRSGPLRDRQRHGVT